MTLQSELWSLTALDVHDDMENRVGRTGTIRLLN